MNTVAKEQLEPVTRTSVQPNELDRKRIERALVQRRRYRYVTPAVHAMDGGYRIDSRCCSCNIDPDGGVIDVALLKAVPGPMPWLLYRKDHEARRWELHGQYARLVDLLTQLNADPGRLFWQ